MMKNAKIEEKKRSCPLLYPTWEHLCEALSSFSFQSLCKLGSSLIMMTNAKIEKKIVPPFIAHLGAPVR